MKILVTGSAGHLGEALVETLRNEHEVVGVDINASPGTTIVGCISNEDVARQSMHDIDVVLHTATLHKPHVATHSMRQFVDTNIQGTLNLLQESIAANVDSFIFTSTTSVFGAANRPPRDQAAAWITENVQPIPRNIYGVSKTAAEDLCHLFHRKHDLPCLILRTSRFFAEADDDPTTREAFEDSNVKTNEFTYRRVDLQDVVDAHLLAIQRAETLGFGRYIISATSPFTPEDVSMLRNNAPEVLRRRVPEYQSIYEDLGWRMHDGLDRVYDNSAARTDLGWAPKYDFRSILGLVQQGLEPRSPLAQRIGRKGYHDTIFQDGPYPVE